MRTTNRFFLSALVILFLCGTVGTVCAVEPAVADFNGAPLVTCADPPMNYNGEITTSKPIDYYSVDLLANQVLSIDIDAENIGSSLDSLLEVFEVVGGEVFLIVASDDTETGGEISLDPYLEVTAPPDKDVTYYLVISASNAYDEDKNTGTYQFSLTCAEPSTTPVEPVNIGDLLGVTDSDPGSLLTVDPQNAVGTLRFPLANGPVNDIEFDPTSTMLWVALDTGYPGSIVAIDPNDRNAQGAVSTYEDGGFVTLESGGDTLYGVLQHLVDGKEKYSLVTIAEDMGVLTLDTVATYERRLTSLAYHSSKNMLYAAASGGTTGSELVTIDLTSGVIFPVGDPAVGKITALDFDPNNVLYAVTESDPYGEIGKLFEINPVDAKMVRELGPVVLAAASTESGSVRVSGLTFVVEDTPLPNEPAVGQICSSSLSDSTTANSTSSRSKLSKFKLRRNPLHRAIGLFKFYAEVPDAQLPTKITIRVGPEGEESAEDGQESITTGLETLWPDCKGEGRVFLGLRDKIDGVDLKINKKGTIPLEIKDAELPATGWYYIMVIRPLPRFFRTDYCLTLETTNSDTANSLQLVWPGDDSQQDATTEEEAMAAESKSVDSTTVTVSIEGANEPASVSSEEPVVDESEAASPNESATDAENSGDMQPADETAVDESGALTVEEIASETPVVDEPAAETDIQPTDDEATGTESSDGDSTEEYADDVMRGAPPAL